MRLRRSIQLAAVLVGAVLAFGVAPAHAVFIDFTTATFGDQGTAYVVNSDLTLSARSSIPDGDTTQSLTGGLPGVVFIGELGKMDAAVDVSNCPDAKDKNCGVGVRGIEFDKDGNPKFDKDGKLKTEGSKGISGGGGHQDESLIFDFNDLVKVADGSISVQLIGLDFGTDSKDDIVSLTIDYLSGPDQIFANINSFITPASPTSLGTLNFSSLSLSGANVDRFAIRAVTGHFGVTSLTYRPTDDNGGPQDTVIPEPMSLMLVGFGGLGMFGLGGLQGHRSV